MTTKVIHIRDCWKYPQQKLEYIGRGTKWGNTYRIGKDGTRGFCVQMYEDVILPRFTARELRTLKGKVLVCHCKPRACHGDPLARRVDKLR